MSNEAKTRQQDNVEVGPRAEVSLAQLAAAIAQLQQQIQEVNRRLDMVYGAVNRLAETTPDSRPAAGGLSQNLGISGRGESSFTPTLEIWDAPAAGPAPRPENSRVGTPPASLNMARMMDPGSMLDSLRQYAVEAGLDVSADMVDRLKSGMPQGE